MSPNLFNHLRRSADTTNGYRNFIGDNAILVIDPNTTNSQSAVLTTVAVWSQVEAGIAVIAACSPSIRPLFHRKSLESLVDSLRSAMSLHSLNNPQHRLNHDNDPTRRDTATILDKVGKGRSGNVYPTINTDITRNYESSDDIPANAIYLQSGLGVEEKHV